MALLWFDGFDHYTDQNTLIGVSPLVTGTYLYTFGGIWTMPELGSKAFRVSSGQGGTAMRWPFPGGDTTDETYGIGFHLYLNSLNSSNRFVQFESATGAIKYQIGINSDDNVTIYSGTGAGTPLASSTETILSGVLYHFEVKLVQHPSAGSIEVRVNGQTWVSATGLNTSTEIGSLGLRYSYTSSGTSDQYYDNLYVWDGTGTENNDWLGERNVYTLLPDRDGSETDWTLSTGSDGYALINGVPPGSEYLEAQNVGDVSSFGFEELPTTDINIIGAHLIASASKTGTNLTEISFGPGSVRGASHALTQDQFLRFSDIYEVNPDTGESWEPGEINTLEIEIERDT